MSSNTDEFTSWMLMSFALATSQMRGLFLSATIVCLIVPPAPTVSANECSSLMSKFTRKSFRAVASPTNSSWRDQRESSTNRLDSPLFRERPAAIRSSLNTGRPSFSLRVHFASSTVPSSARLCISPSGVSTVRYPAPRSRRTRCSVLSCGKVLTSMSEY